MPTIHSKSDPSSGSGIFVKYPRVGGYTVLDHLHEGSHSSIYMARQHRLGRVVAMKLLPEWPPPTDVALERFNRAAYVCAHTPSPGLATLFDVGTRDGYYYATYTHLEGQTLQRHLGIAGQIDESFAAKTGMQICRTLMALHGNNICHRNVKPKNLFLENNGNLRMIGLGLASCKSAFFSPHLDAHAIGTPHFMAPEMIKGSCADSRSDLYSLGVTLYVMVAGRPPYDRGIPAVVMSRHLTDTPVSLKEVRPDLSAKFISIVDGLMVKDPSKRIQSAAEAASMFESLAKKNSSFWKISPLTAPLISPRAAPVAIPEIKLPAAEPIPNIPNVPNNKVSAKAAPAAEPKRASVKSSTPATAARIRLNDPVVAAILAALCAIVVLLGAMYVAAQYIGKKSSSPDKAVIATPQVSAWRIEEQPAAPEQIQLVPEPDRAAEVVKAAPAPVPVPVVDLRPREDFEQLLGHSDQYQDDPAAGIAAWTDFIEKYPHMTTQMRAIADQRLEIYQLAKVRSNLDLRPKTKEPEF